MKSTRSEEDFPLNSESDVSGASFSDDDDISEASDDHMSTISIDNSAGHKTDGDYDIEVEPYLEDFPFNYYVVVQEFSDLPQFIHRFLVKRFSQEI